MTQSARAENSRGSSSDSWKQQQVSTKRCTDIRVWTVRQCTSFATHTGQPNEFNPSARLAGSNGPEVTVEVPILHLVAIMSLVNTGCSLRSSTVHNRCGRNGSPSSVRRGMQCHTCKAWWHFKCMGLQDDQKKTIKHKTNSPLPNHTVQCKGSSSIDVLAAKLELLSKALTDASTKKAAIWTKVDKELSSLNEYLALSTPGPLAAIKFIRLSDAAIKTATASLVDRRVRQ
ncbi:hypothetical protein CLF_111012 [Clonorchis sinensis]|uniref:Uncharacterized protein n=1 Tax=Clonorchis sinensis TaxID=79923 RepID=G7YU72_CLOSI|nr:hypothetical protein CLF_111012 [Clonorchis sinensis]